MIRGFCIGGGLLTALQADIRIAADDSQFGVPAARLGLGYGFGGVDQLMQLVGPSWASEILFSARRLTAAEALHVGLVNRVVPAETLRDEVWSLAGAIRDNAPLTVRSLKVAIREAQRAPSSATSSGWRRWSRRASGPRTTGKVRRRSSRSGHRRSAAPDQSGGFSPPSFSPGRGHSVASSRPLDDTVMYAVAGRRRRSRCSS